MQCDQTQESVSRFLDSGLEEVEQKAMFRHLEGCDLCRGFLESMIRVRAAAGVDRMTLLREAEETLPPAEALLRRARRGAPATGPGSRRLWASGWRIPAPIAVGLGVLLLVAGLLIGSRIPPEARRTATPAEGLEPASGPTVVLVSWMPEVAVVGSRERR
jgi:anti-sigma factor RsiW